MRYRSIFDVVRDFLHDEAFEGQEKVLAKYLKPDLLIIDDMGIKSLPKKSGEFLFEIILRRYETRSTIMTSNRPLEDWGKLIGDVPAATAILDRFLHHAEIIKITGRSYRLRNQAENSPGNNSPATEQVQLGEASTQIDSPSGTVKQDSKPAIVLTGSQRQKNKKSALENHSTDLSNVSN